MRFVKQTASFKRDLKRESRGENRFILKDEFFDIVYALADDKPLSEKAKDHALCGQFAGCRECHVRLDLLLIYRKEGETLQLVRLGSHSELLGL